MDEQNEHMTVKVTVGSQDWMADMDISTGQVSIYRHDGDLWVWSTHAILQDGRLEGTGDLGEETQEALSRALVGEKIARYGFLEDGTRDGTELYAEWSDGWTVVDPGGGRWRPDPETREEIDRAPVPAAAAVRVCCEQPHKGTWHY